MDTLPDIFSKYSQGSAASKNSFKSKQKKCGKTIDDILGSAEPFEEKTEKKRKNKRTVDKFQEDVEKDFDWLSISNSHTLLSKESEISVQEDEEMFLRASLEEALERDAEMNVSLQEIHDEVLEEQIDEVIEEQIDEVVEEQIDEVIKVDMTGYNYQETVEALPEEVEEQCSVSSEDNYTPFSEGSEISVQEDKEMFLRASLQEALEREAETNASLQEALEREEETNVSLQEALEREARTKASLEEALKKEKAQQEEILEQERKEKALEKTLREAEAEKDDLRAVIDLMKAQVADLMKSQMSHEKQKHTITAMTAELDESKKLIIELQKDLEASTLQHEKEMAERENVNCAQMKLLKEHLIQQQEKSLEKDNEIQSLNVKLQTLQMTIEAKDKIVSTLREKVERSASDLKEEETKNSELKRDYEAILSQQQKDEEKQKHLIQENQKLISENKRLQNKLEGQLLQKEPQEDDEACSRLEEDIPVDKARFLTACKKIQMQKEELAEKTLALEKSLTAEKYLRSSLRKEKKRFDQMVFQKQTSAEPDTFLKNQLREASANSECLTYDMQTLRMDNADIRAKFSATEAEFDKLKSKYTSLSERYQEMMLEKNETISENQHTITKLQCKAQKLKSRFEGIINKERTKNSELQQKVDQISSALEKEKTMCEKQRVELMEASTKQMTTLEEKQKLSLALQKAQEKAFSFKEPLGVSSIQSRHNSNYEFMLKQQRISLDKSTAALNHLQKQNSDITSEHRELLKTHSTLKLKYDKLLYERGNLDKSTAALNHLQKQNSDITSEHRELLKTHSTLKLKYDKLLYERGNQSCVHFGMQLSANLTS
ncbi:myosin-13-like isoform X1 [Larimichthys crocea]|uniref:myosin-13-like isoform X1 n=1 Tax=Larimichthys crocea TaxID=215358 RepID=UPI000F603B59|nr:myosin-13-like isoform X1 [Larimichthys crocea]